jgi:hypothetical protein
LDSSENAVLVMPVTVVELGKVMGILDVFEGEPRLEPSREGEHLVALELFHRREPVIGREEVARVVRNDVAKHALVG